MRLSFANLITKELSLASGMAFGALFDRFRFLAMCAAWQQLININRGLEARKTKIDSKLLGYKHCATQIVSKYRE
jgi:hypothetical protein